MEICEIETEQNEVKGLFELLLKNFALPLYVPTARAKAGLAIPLRLGPVAVGYSCLGFSSPHLCSLSW